MRYGITRLAAGEHPFIPIWQEEFTRIKNAKACYRVVLGIEEKLDLLLENYAEFEGGLLSLTLRRAIFRDLDWAGLMDDMQVTNRRLANLLMSVRLYTHQVKRNAAALFGRRGQTTMAINEVLDEQRRSSFGLRVLEELRDHIQHRDLPVKHLTHLRGGNRTVTSGRLRFGIRPALQIAALKEDPKFDPDILKVLEKEGATVAVTPYVREGVEAVCRVHERLRELAAPDIETWCGILQDVLARGREVLGEDITALGVVAEDDEEHCFESEQVFEDILQRRVALLRKNRRLSNLSLRFVSGELEEGGG